MEWQARIRAKIPKNAKRVFKGKIFDVYHYEQKMYDGSYATFEVIKRQDAVQIMPIVGNKIMISYESQPSSSGYGLIGGRIDRKGETLLKTARRELLEEAGLKSNDWLLLRSFKPNDAKYIYTVYLFIARNCQKASKQRPEPGEKIRLTKVSLNRFLSMRIWLRPDLIFFFNKILSSKSEVKKLERKLFSM